MNGSVFSGAGNMLAVVVVACFIVLVAMTIDLCSGLHKARIRGEVCSSFGLKRSLSKFIMYEGGMLIAAGIDFLIQLSNILHVFGVEQLYGIPFITCFLGIFLLIVEYRSVREKAEDKTKREMRKVEALAARMVTKDDLAKVIAEAILQSHKKESEE